MTKGEKGRGLRWVRMASPAAALLAVSAAPNASEAGFSPAVAQSAAARLAAPPADRVMGFVVSHFVQAVLMGKDACPDGPVLKTREFFLSTLPSEESERLQKKENEAEFNRRWAASMTGPNGTNMCSQYTMFPDRPTIRTVQSPYALGLNLDGDEGDGSSSSEGCGHENFTSPAGDKGIDNQAYRAMGCKLEWRGVDNVESPLVRGATNRLASGENTQVLLLRGVDSLVNDESVEVVYANTPDRPIVDSAGKFIWHASFTVSDTFPRERNVLRGRIVNGVLTTEPTLIKLTQVWGQSAQRDLRGIRSRWTLIKGRIRLVFQPDGTLKGIVGGYQPLDEFVKSASIGGMGSLQVAGIDCAAEYNTLRKMADGVRDPNTGQCTAISNALELEAIPAFVNDLPGTRRIASQ